MASNTGHISLEIQTSPIKVNNKLNFTGEYVDIIDATEEVTFNVEDEALKEAVQKYFGKRPNDAFLHSPTPWNDLYKTYKWEETKRHIKVQSFNIKSFEAKDILIQRRTVSNETNKPIVLNGIDIQGTTYDTATIYWDVTGKLMLFDELDLKINLDDIQHSQDKLNLKIGWEKASSDLYEVVMSKNKPGNITVDPKTQLIIELFAKEVKAVYEIDLIANLTGKTAVNYNPKYKGHHFYGFDIGRVLRLAGNRNEVKAKLTVEVITYPRSTGRLDSHVVNIADEDENKDLSEFMVVDDNNPNEAEIVESKDTPNKEIPVDGNDDEILKQSENLTQVSGGVSSGDNVGALPSDNISKLIPGGEALEENCPLVEEKMDVVEERTRGEC